MLVKWNHDRELNSMFDYAFKPLFGDFFNYTDTQIFNKRKIEDDLVLTSEVPGLKKEDLEVGIKNRVLTIKGETKDKKAYKKYSFTKQFTLPYDLDIENLSPEAELEDGVLNIKFKDYYKEEGPPKVRELRVPIK